MIGILSDTSGALARPLQPNISEPTRARLRGQSAVGGRLTSIMRVPRAFVVSAFALLGFAHYRFHQYLHSQQAVEQLPASSVSNSAVSADSPTQAVAAAPLAIDTASMDHVAVDSAAAAPTDYVAVDTANCAQEGSESCTACLRIRARKQPADSGVRCVWCASLSACRGYVKGSLAWPCDDAARGGGGYPGGSKCTRSHPRRAAAAPSLGGRQLSSSIASASSTSASAASASSSSSATALLTPPVLATPSVTPSLAPEPLEPASLRVQSLWFRKAATRFADALPLGNGQVPDERLKSARWAPDRRLMNLDETWRLLRWTDHLSNWLKLTSV